MSAVPHDNSLESDNGLVFLPLSVLNEIPALGAPDEDWTKRALCPQTDPEAFYPERGGSTREAKKICLGCEVQKECLDWALANDERFGIWGGLSERERRRLKYGPDGSKRRALERARDEAAQQPAQIVADTGDAGRLAG